MKMKPIYPQQLRCAGGIIMWMPTLGHSSSNHKGYNDSYRYNHKDCNRTPTAQATGLKDGKRQFHRNPRNWHLQSLRSVWDCQYHADQPDTFTPSHMERWCDRGSHRTHRTVPLRENTSLNQDHIKTNRMEEFPYLLWRTKRLRTERGRVWDAPTTLMGKPWSRHQPSGIYPRHRACRSG